MESTVKERLIRFVKSKHLTIKKFEQLTGLSNGYINNIVSEPRKEKLEKILLTFPELDRVWLLTGEGSMTKAAQSPTGIPYYEKLPATAGKGEMTKADEEPTGYINIPGVCGKYCFPVVGCSMEPVISAGDMVVVDEVNNWDRPDPDKIYMIVTSEDRMIKHLEPDMGDNEVLWCVSPNYQRFSIMKDDIKFIYKVTYIIRAV